MIQILHYEVVNGERQRRIPFDKVIQDKKELENVRKYLEGVHECWKEERTITGVNKKQIKHIDITYKIIE